MLADGAVNKDLAGPKLDARLSPNSQIQFETVLQVRVYQVRVTAPPGRGLCESCNATHDILQS